jgi:hypothetical protein
MPLKKPEVLVIVRRPGMSRLTPQHRTILFFDYGP